MGYVRILEAPSEKYQSVRLFTRPCGGHCSRDAVTHPVLGVLSCFVGGATRRWAGLGQADGSAWPCADGNVPPGGRDRCDATGNSESSGEAGLPGVVQEGFLEEAGGERPR